MPLRHNELGNLAWIAVVGDLIHQDNISDHDGHQTNNRDRFFYAQALIRECKFAVIHQLSTFPELAGCRKVVRN